MCVFARLQVASFVPHHRHAVALGPDLWSADGHRDGIPRTRKQSTGSFNQTDTTVDCIGHLNTLLIRTIEHK